MISRLTRLTKEIVDGDVRYNRSIVYKAINIMTGKPNVGACPHTMLQTGLNCNGCSFTSVEKFGQLLGTLHL